MFRTFGHFVFVLVLCAVVFGSTAVDGAKAQKSAPKAAPVQPQPAPPPPAPPPPELTPEQGPSSPPEVTFDNGQLMILARNSTMGDVLNAVRQKTGAAVEMPAVSSERVAGQFGPGAPRDVIAQLLNGSHYDYVLVGSPADPGALKKIVLMAKANGPQPVARSAQANNQPGDESLQAVPEVESDTSEDTSADTSTQDTQPAEEEPQAEQSEQQQNVPAVKTPEQLLRELQQQQRQQQQQNMGAPQGAPGQPPQ
ncbi:MAG: hypothetical protein J2P13_00680 [Acidobacteria bacterium]|nr:hypothetical protein [Acidobacteriota bacterium]